MKKWLVIEVVLLTLVPTALLMYSLPVLIFGVLDVALPVSGDARALHERVLGMLPYVGGLIGLWVIWRCALALFIGKKFPLDWLFVVGAIGGGLASWELMATTNIFSSALICAPVWVLVAHLLYLRTSAEDGHV